MDNKPLTLLILNGKGAGNDDLREAITTLREEGFDIAVRVTFEKGDGDRYVREAIALQDSRGEPADVAPGDGHRVWLRVPEEVDLRFALLLRNFDHGEDTRDPHNRLPTETI